MSWGSCGRLLKTTAAGRGGMLAYTMEGCSAKLQVLSDLVVTKVADELQRMCLKKEVTGGR